MHIAQFVHRYPPARGGAEAYAHRLTQDLIANGDTVDVWTTTAVELEEFWVSECGSFFLPSLLGRGRGRVPKPQANQMAFNGCGFGTLPQPLPRREGSENNRRYRPLTFPLRRYVLKALTFLPSPRLRSFVLPCNPICPGMWRDAARYDGPLDAVHAMAFPYAFPILCARRLARRRGVPFLLTPFLHLGDERTKRQYTQPALAWLLRDADAVFVQTTIERDACLDLGVKPERVILQGLGVDADECTGGDGGRFRRRWGIHGEVVIGHLANLSVEKGSVDLLRACEKLWNQGCDFKLVLAGPSMANFHKVYRDHANVIVTGMLSDEEKRDFYAGIDAFALPSRSDSFGLVLLEAWANGVPNLAYRAGGPGELIRHGQDGLLAECGNVPELAARIHQVVVDEQWRYRMGQHGQQRVCEFSWERSLNIVRDQIHFRLPQSQSRLRKSIHTPLA